MKKKNKISAEKMAKGLIKEFGKKDALKIIDAFLSICGKDNEGKNE